MNAPFTSEDLCLGNAPIDPERVEYLHDRRAVYGKAPWAVSRIRVIREFGLVLMALQGGFGVPVEDLVALNRKGGPGPNAVMQFLLKRHAAASVAPTLTRAIRLFREDVHAADRDRLVNLRGHIEDQSLYFTDAYPHGLYEFVLTHPSIG